MYISVWPAVTASSWTVCGIKINLFNVSCSIVLRCNVIHITNCSVYRQKYTSPNTQWMITECWEKVCVLPLSSRANCLKQFCCWFGMHKKGIPLCRKSWLKSWLKSRLKSAWNKHGYFNITSPLHYADFRDWSRDWIFQNEQFWKILTEIVKQSIIQRTRLFLYNRLHFAENWQSWSRFFSGSGWSLWIFKSRACCAWRRITSTSSLLRQS